MTQNCDSMSSSAVYVQQLLFSYGRVSAVNRPELDRVDLNVPRGVIYGLLGPSGCGKTTLLRCIIGRLKPQKGIVKVFDAKPGNQIGYMPQHTSLYNEFTIEENLRYFGRLYGMSDNSITNKINELLKLLDMPESDRIVSQLSGGQQRRVSLCVALIHSPMLVILDEPTVGVDPLLRHQIWQYLEMICEKNSVSVIITTHYIEEARNASTVAFLRDGQIIVEQNPGLLLKKYNCDKLEDAILIVCKRNRLSICDEKLVQEIDNCNNDNKISLPKKHNENRAQFWALFRKNMLTFYRCQRLLSLFCILNPPIMLFYWVILKHDIQYTLSYHNSDTLNLSTEYISLLSDKMFKKQVKQSENALINSVIDGTSKVGISISSNFTQDLDRIFIKNDFTSNRSGAKVYLEIIDITDLYIIPELTKTYMTLAQNYLSSIGLNPYAAQSPFEQIMIYGNSQLNVFDFSIPSCIALAIFASSFTFGLHSIVNEKVERVFERSIIAGVNSFSYYCAQLSTKTLILLLQAVIYTTILYPLIGAGFANVLLMYLFVFLQGMFSITLGILFSSFITNQMLAIVADFIFMMIFVCIGGFVWPLEALPQVVQYLSTYLLPISLPIKSLHCILFRGWSIGHYEVWIGLVSNIFYSVIYFTVAVIYSHWSVFKN